MIEEKRQHARYDAVSSTIANNQSTTHTQPALVCDLAPIPSQRHLKQQ